MASDVPFSWRPTGWFQVGWSHDVPTGRAVPLRYFGEDLVAYRGETGELHVLDAHCPHLGAHIGHGGRVVGDCVTCPYHGWVWSPEGANVSIPYQEAPNRSKRLRSWPVSEQYGCVFVWHHPRGDPPSWPMPDVFRSFPQFETDPAAYYEPVTAAARDEPVHPQLVAENGPDSVHFAYVHRATVLPVALHWEPDGPIWKFVTGWPRTRSAQGGQGGRGPRRSEPQAVASGGARADEMALRIHSWLFGLGGSVTAFEGVQQHRLAFTVTPVEPGRADLFYTVWWPRLPGDDAPHPPPDLQRRIEEEFLSTMEDDLEIWRYQRYVANPALAKQDATPYKALRKWAMQFYDVPVEEDRRP